METAASIMVVGFWTDFWFPHSEVISLDLILNI